MEIEIVTNDLITKIKDIRDQNALQWAKLIANPHGYAADSIDLFRRDIVLLAAVLMEHDVKIVIPNKERTAEDVLKEGMGELGLMLGSKAFSGALSFWRRVKDDMMDHELEYQEAEDEYYQRDDGTYFFIEPETGEEVECNEDGEEI